MTTRLISKFPIFKNLGGHLPIIDFDWALPEAFIFQEFSIHNVDARRTPTSCANFCAFFGEVGGHDP